MLIRVAEIGDGAIVGAVIGALLGCILIALLVWFITHNMKKKKYRAAKTTEANEMKSVLPLCTYILCVYIYITILCIVCL